MNDEFNVMLKMGGVNGEKLEGTLFPFSFGDLLDESLDEANISVILSSKSKIPMQTKLTAIITQGEKTRQKTYVVANDTVDETPLGQDKYSHTLYLLEETKLLESVTCGELTFTNSKTQIFAPDTWVVTS